MVWISNDGQVLLGNDWDLIGQIANGYAYGAPSWWICQSTKCHAQVNVGNTKGHGDALNGNNGGLGESAVGCTEIELYNKNSVGGELEAEGDNEVQDARKAVTLKHVRVDFQVQATVDGYILTSVFEG